MTTSGADPSPSTQIPEFPNFSVQELVTSGKLLLASSGKEFIRPAGILSSPAEVKKARKEAMGRLGLEFLDMVDGIDIDKELDDAEMEDAENAENEVESHAAPSPMDVCPPPALAVKTEDKPRTRSTTPAEPSPTTCSTPEPDLSALSARERNRLKRKNRDGNSAFVQGPPPQTAGSRYRAAPTGTAKYNHST